MTITLGRGFAFAALVVLIVVAVFAYFVPDAGTAHLIGGLAIAGACMAAAAVAP